MQRTTRRAFLAFVSTSILAVTTEASAGIFSRCRRRRRCVHNWRRCRTAAAQNTSYKTSCAGKVCLHSLIGEIEDLNGGCMYRQYEAYQCEPNGSYTTILHERDCQTVTPLPQGTCASSNTCTNCEGGFVPVPRPHFKDSAPPLGRGHSAGNGLAKNGMRRYGDAFKPLAGQKVIDTHIALMPGNQTGTNTRRRVKLVWIQQQTGALYGIGFEVAQGAPDIAEQDVKHKPLVPGQKKPLSYSVTIRIGSQQRHYSAYMKK